MAAAAAARAAAGADDAAWRSTAERKTCKHSALALASAFFPPGESTKAVLFRGNIRRRRHHSPPSNVEYENMDYEIGSNCG